MTDHDAAPLRAERLSFDWGGHSRLQEISLDVAPGSILALLGPNGAGKSTFVRLAMGMLRPSSGRLRLYGLDPWADHARALASVGVVPERVEAPLSATIEDLLAFCARLRRSWDMPFVRAMFSRQGIPLKRPLGELSKGQQKLGQLGLAMAHHPGLLILDDPTLGLDPLARDELWTSLLGEVAERGTSVLLCTHELAAVARIANHVALLDAGRLAFASDLESLRERCQRVRFEAPGRSPQALRQSFADLEPMDVRGSGQAFELRVAAFDARRLEALRLELGLLNLECEPLDLESIFLANFHRQQGEVRS